MNQNKRGQLSRPLTRLGSAAVASIGVITCLLVAACGQSASPSTSAAAEATATTPAPVELNVSAVVALQGVLEATTAEFEAANNCTIVLNTASAGVLQTQVEGGSETDVVLLTPKEVKSLIGADLVSSETTVTFALNSLIVMVADGNPVGIDDPSDLAVCEMLTTGDVETTAQGPKAKEWLTNIGLWDSLQSKFVFAKDAAQINQYVSSGEVDAAICFSSNAANQPGLEIAYTVPSAEYTTPKHVAAIVGTSTQADLAEKYIEYLQSEGFQNALLEAGFRLPAK